MMANRSAVTPRCDHGADSSWPVTSVRCLALRLVDAGHAAQIIGLAGMVALLFLNGSGV